MAEQLDSEEEIVEEIVVSNDDSNVRYVQKSYYNNQSLSALCKPYFEMKSLGSDRNEAECKLCGKVIKYQGGLSNLKRHIRSLHKDIEDYHLFQVTSSTSNNSRSRHFSPVWNHFARLKVGDKICECIRCHRRLSYKVLGNLKRHLRLKHPDVIEDEQRNLFVTNDGQYFELRTSENAAGNSDNGEEENYFDEIYLDESNDDTNDPIKVRKESTQNSASECLTKRQNINKLKLDNGETQTTKKKSLREYYMDSADILDDEEPLKHKKTYDSIDYFAKYITVLLRKLPEETSNRLQADFICQIMRAESKSSAKRRDTLKAKVGMTEDTIKDDDETDSESLSDNKPI